MSGYAPEGTGARTVDPVVKFLSGCAIVAGVLIAVVLILGTFVGWSLVRDETPGRPEEAFLTSDDTGYWCLELRPDDPGLVAFVEGVQSQSEVARTEALKNTPLVRFPFPRRRPELDKLLPLRIEIASAGGKDDARSRGWTARATLSKAVLRTRAALKLVRFLATRDPAHGRRFSVEGVETVVLHDEQGHDVALAMVGNRVLAAGDPQRLEDVLRLGRQPAVEGNKTFPPPEARHGRVKGSDEIGWGFQDDFEITSGGGPRSVVLATASFRLGKDGALALQVAAEGNLGVLDAEGARAIVRRFLPGIDLETILLADGSPRLQGDHEWIIDATVPAFAGKLFRPAFRRIEEPSRAREEGLSAPPAPRTPSATPTPPSPPPTSGPRTGTPAVPRRAENPSPAR